MRRSGIGARDAGRAGRLAAAGVLALLAAAAVAAPSGSAAHKQRMLDVVVVSNNWAGTADVVAVPGFRRLARINIIPDRREREREIQASPDDRRRFYFRSIREIVGEGHNQWVDDAFLSGDGRRLFVSRPSFADVIAIDLRSRRIVWRRPVDGYRADHMALSPDGRRLLVSASTARTVDVIDTRGGRIAGRFPSGDSPHENNFSPDGKLIYHASIGFVYTGNDDPSQDATKGDRWFEVVDARTLRVKRRIDVGKRLAETGRPGYSSAVRPMAIAPGGRYAYMQLSFLHGFVEYDLKANRPLRIARLPVSAGARLLRRSDYLLDSAHHGLAMNPQGTKLCVAGTMSGYAAVVSRRTLRARVIPVGRVPYWATNSLDGRYCLVSVAGEDRVSVISYATEREVRRIKVGDHPQRMRAGRVAVPSL